MTSPFKRVMLLFLSILICLLLASCDQDDDHDDDDSQSTDDDDDSETAPPSFVILLDSDASRALRIAADDASDLLEGALQIEVPVITKMETNTGAILISVGQSDVSQAVFTPAQRQDMPAESFRLRKADFDGATAFAIFGADDQGAQYGLYDLLEEFGFGFFHPEQTFLPSRDTIRIPKQLDLFESPSWKRRGFHIHTMHPTPHSEFLQRGTPQYLEFSKRLLDWHVRNKQNYIQWELLRTVDYDATVDHFRAIVKYGHDRLMDMGIVGSYAFAQQKAWRIIPNPRQECVEQMQANIDQLMQVPWDHLHFEMGTSEFTKASDQLQVAWMDNAAAYLREKYPGTDSSVKVHCSSGQTAPNYDDINFNYLAQFADPEVGVYPHTVQFYDLQGPAPTYDNETFDELVQWMLERIGERKVYYYPETAYWCSWDIDVPLFFPVYLFNRWKDIVFLAGEGLDGHVTFTSGHEWGYWLNDWTVARYTWNSDQDWTEAIDIFGGVFGQAGPEIAQASIDLTLDQEETMIGKNLAPYLAGTDTWDELGYLVGTLTHPKGVLFKELYRMDADQIGELQTEVVDKLAEIVSKYTELYQTVAALHDQVPVAALPWFDELVDCFHVNLLRARHAYLLYAGACAQRLFELDGDTVNEQTAAEHFENALLITQEQIALVHKREQSYRYPLFLSIGWERSLTSYDFRYLWQASVGYWNKRYEKQAIDKLFNPFIDNVIDPLWFIR